MNLPRAPKIRTLAVVHIGGRSGAAISLAPVLRWLSRTGEVRTLLPERGQIADDYSDFSSISTLPFEAITIPRGPFAVATAFRRAMHEVREFRREIRRYHPDLAIVLTSSLPAALLATRLERVPTVARVAESYRGRSATGRRRGPLARPLLSLTEALTSSIVCCSGTVAAQFRHRDRVFTAYPPIDPHPSAGDGLRFRRAHGLERANPLIAVVGNLTSGRGQDLAIRAMPAIRKRFPAAACALVGAPHPRRIDEEFAASLRDLADQLGVREAIRFAGFERHVEDVYAACDAVLNPVRASEGFGRVACEALVAGKPIVSTDAGAIPEILRDGTDALLVGSEDVAAIADSLLRVLSDGALASRLVENGRQWVVGRYGIEDSVRSFSEAIACALPANHWASAAT